MIQSLNKEPTMNTLEKNISSFSVFIFILKVFGLARMKENETVAEKISSRTLPLSFFFIFFLFFFMDSFRLSNDAIIIFCQFIDRIVSTIILELMLLDAAFFDRCYASMFHIWSEIDEIITRDLKIKINYKKCKFINIFIALFSLPVFLMLQARLIMVGGFSKIFYLVLSIVVTLSTFVELFFIAIVIQIYFRMTLIEKFMLNEQISHRQKEKLIKIFSKCCKLIYIVNDIFGISLLLIGGKIIIFKPFNLLFRLINFSVKHFVKITTRVYILFHLLSYDSNAMDVIPGKNISEINFA